MWETHEILSANTVLCLTSASIIELAVRQNLMFAVLNFALNLHPPTEQRRCAERRRQHDA